MWKNVIDLHWLWKLIRILIPVKEITIAAVMRMVWALSYTKYNFRCDEVTDIIVLHIDALTIEEDTIELIDDDSQTTLQWSRWEEDKSRQFFKVSTMRKKRLFWKSHQILPHNF